MTSSVKLRMGSLTILGETGSPLRVLRGSISGFGHHSAMVKSSALFASAVALFMPALLQARHPLIRWTETTWEDFRDGDGDDDIYVSRRTRLEPDSGCVEFFVRFDVDNNGYYDLATSDDSGPNLCLYLGDETGYAPERRLVYPITAGGNVELADLNLDGNAELIHSGWRMHAVSIYWGTPGGPSPTNPTLLSYGGNAEDVCVYDLDKDGYLDVIAGSSDSNLYLFWGSATGWSSSNRTQYYIGHSMGHNIEVADFDRDGWGDLALSTWTFGESPLVYWGPGRQPRRVVWLPGRWNNSHGLSIADLDQNGWLDLVYNGYDTVTISDVYFGSAAGFSPANRTSIRPGQCYGGSASVDWNRDGWLDLVFFRGNWTNGGIWRPSVYFNTGAPPYFNDGNYIEVGPFAFNASGGFIADFDFDGELDCFVNNMLPNDSSYLLWGPTYARYTALPVHNDHHGVFREPGNTYDRRYRSNYHSSVMDAGAGNRVTGGTVSWIAHEPQSSRIEVAYRTGPSPIPDSFWQPFAQVPGNGGAIPDSGLGQRFVQYRVTFTYSRPSELPHLEEISADLMLNTLDCGVEAILAPCATVDSGTVVTPQAVVRNFCDRAVMCPVWMWIGSRYSEARSVTLVPGQMDTVSFPDWVALPRGSVGVRCSTALLNDSNPTNDLETTSVAVRVHDAGAVRIIAPRGTIVEGDSVWPCALVVNYGTVPEDMHAVFRIGAVCCETIAVPGLLPDSQRAVVFPPWLAQAGRFVCSCSTELALDMVPANDKVLDSVRVVGIGGPDVAVERILVPGSIVDSGLSLVPAAIILNYSLRALSFPVLFHIEPGYRDSVWLDLPGLGYDTVEFRAWTAQPRGMVSVSCTAALAGDTNPVDNSRSESTLVAVRDVEAVEIRAPGDSMGSGQAIAPRALVRNLGNVAGEFTARFAIGTVYDRSVAVSGLQPDSSAEVVFPLWVAQPGQFALTCSTQLARDVRPANDAVRGSVIVTFRSTGVMIEPDAFDSVADGAYVDYTCTVTNLGNADDTLDLEVQALSSGPGWAHELLDLNGSPLMDWNRNGKPDVGGVSSPNGSARFVLRVSAPSGARQGLVDTVRVWACSGYDPLVKDHILVRTQVKGRLDSLVVAPDERDDVPEGMTRVYSLYALLSGNMSDLVDMNLEVANPDWEVRLLDAGGQNPVLQLGPLAPDTAVPFLVRVTAPDEVPEDLAGAPESLSACAVRVIGRSRTRPALADTAFLLFRAVPGLAIHNYENPFRDRTRFIFSVPKAGRVHVNLYTRAGEYVGRLIDQDYQPGIYTEPWDASIRGQRLVPGTYVYVYELTGSEEKRSLGSVRRKLMIR